MRRVAGHTRLLGSVGHPTEYARGVFFDLLVMFREFIKCLPLRRSRFWHAEPIKRLAPKRMPDVRFGSGRVCFGPEADIAPLFDQLVSKREKIVGEM